MSFKPFSVLLYGTAAATMAYGYQGLGGLLIDTWIRTQRGGHFQFLTIQGLAVSFITMVLALTAEIFPSMSFFRKAKRALLMVALPVEVVVSAVYWPLILLAPSLIAQKDSSAPSSSSAAPNFLHIPLKIDLSLHAVPALSLLLDFIFLEEKYSKKEVRYGAPLVASLATIWYACWVEYCTSFNGNYPYPFLETTWENRVAIYVGAGTLALTSFWAANYSLVPFNDRPFLFTLAQQVNEFKGISE